MTISTSLIDRIPLGPGAWSVTTTISRKLMTADDELTVMRDRPGTEYDAPGVRFTFLGFTKWRINISMFVP